MRQIFRRKIIQTGIVIAGLFISAPSFASLIAYTNEGSFQAALTGGFTLVNLDAPPLNAFTSGYRVETTGPAAAFAGLGIDFRFVNARVVAGQDSQIAKPGRDRLIANGTGFDGNIVFDLLSPGHGVGAWSNEIDGGTIRAFDGLGLSGNLIGVAALNEGIFGGLISTDLIRSVQITCDFNSDLRCGVFDIQFGTVAAVASNIPEPATLSLLGTGLAGIGWARRRRYKSA